MPCDTCFYAKRKRLPFQESKIIYFKPFDLIHMDIWGAFSIPFILGHEYFLTVIYYHTRYCWIF